MVEGDRAGSQGRVFSVRLACPGDWPIVRLEAKPAFGSARDRRRPVGAEVAEERAGRPRSQGFGVGCQEKSLVEARMLPKINGLNGSLTIAELGQAPAWGRFATEE